MPAGNIALTNNSKSVNGTGTSFTSELKSGDFIGVTVGGSPYTLIVSSVTSDSELTLSTAFDGPTTTGVAWYGVPASLKYAITQQALNDMSKILRNIILEKENWQAVFSEAGDITVKLSDGSTLSGPSWKKIVDLLNELDIDAVQELADQVRADAQQVATDKQAASDTATAAENSRQAALTSSTNANNKAAAAAASATAAANSNTDAQQAKTDAVAAKTAAEQAAASVPSMDNIDTHLRNTGLAGVLANVADLNNIALSGSEIVNFSFLSTATGSPGEAGLGTQWVNGANLVQVVTSSVGNQYRRVKAGTAAWGDWFKVGFNNNDLLNTAWTTPTFQNGWVVMSGHRSVYRKALGLIFIEINISGGTYTDNTVLFTFPAGYRPPYAIHFSAFGPGNATYPARIVVDAAGVVRLVNVTNNNQLNLVAVFSIQ